MKFNKQQRRVFGGKNGRLHCEGGLNWSPYCVVWRLEGKGKRCNIKCRFLMGVKHHQPTTGGSTRNKETHHNARRRIKINIWALTDGEMWLLLLSSFPVNDGTTRNPIVDSTAQHTRNPMHILLNKWNEPFPIVGTFPHGYSKIVEGVKILLCDVCW